MNRSLPSAAASGDWSDEAPDTERDPGYDAQRAIIEATARLGAAAAHDLMLDARHWQALAVEAMGRACPMSDESRRELAAILRRFAAREMIAAG